MAIYIWRDELCQVLHGVKMPRTTIWSSFSTKSFDQHFGLRVATFKNYNFEKKIVFCAESFETTNLHTVHD